MSYKKRAKFKHLKIYIYKIRESLRFKIGHITNAGKVVLFSSIIILFSLGNTWVDSGSGEIAGNAFSRVSGKPAFMLLFILGIVYFSLFSINRKEKLQLVSNLYFKDYTSCILAGIFAIIISISSLNYIAWLQMFESDIISWKWPILSLCGWIMMVVGGFMMKQESSKNIKGTFIVEQTKDNKSSIEARKDNMKLPF